MLTTPDMGVSCTIIEVWNGNLINGLRNNSFLNLEFWKVIMGDQFLKISY